MSDVIHKLPGLHKLTHLSRTIRSSKIIGSSVLTNLEVIDAKFRYKIASCDIGIIFWSFLGYFWVIFGLFLGYFWVIFGLFLGYFWLFFVIFRSFLGYSSWQNKWNRSDVWSKIWLSSGRHENLNFFRFCHQSRIKVLNFFEIFKIKKLRLLIWWLNC